MTPLTTITMNFGYRQTLYAYVRNRLPYFVHFKRLYHCGD
jgi:hypothetical protein